MKVQKTLASINFVDVDNCLDSIDSIYDRIIDLQCSLCGNHMRVPLIARQEDVREFNRLKQVLYDFLENHPEVKESMLKEFLDDLLDYMAGLEGK